MAYMAYMPQMQMPQMPHHGMQMPHGWVPPACQAFAQSGQQALHQSMMTFCQVGTAALQEQQRLAGEMRETLAQIKEMFPREQVQVPCEVQFSQESSPDGEDWNVVTPTTPEHPEHLGQIQMEPVVMEAKESMDPVTPRHPTRAETFKELPSYFDKVLYGDTDHGFTINYDKPVYTHTGHRAVFQESGWGGWDSELVIGDIVRWTHAGDGKKWYGVITKFKKGATCGTESFVLDVIMFIPEKKREHDLPVTGLCGYKIGFQRTFSLRHPLAKLV